MSRELPLYRGAMPQAPTQKMVRVQPMPQLQSPGPAVDKAVAGTVEAINKVVKLHDFGVQQEAENAQLKNDTNMEVALRARMALSYDDPDSFYTPEGRLKEDAVRGFIDEWQQKNNAVPTDFWGSEAEMEYYARLNRTNGRVAERVGLALAGQELQHRKQVYEENLSLALARKDWDGYERAVNDAHDGGQISGKQKELALLKKNEAQYKDDQEQRMQRVSQAAMQGSEQLATLCDDPEFYDSLSPENQAKFDALMARTAGELPARKVRAVKQADGSTKLEAEPQEAPRGLPSALVNKWYKHSGKFDTPDAAEDVRGDLISYLRGLVQHVNDPSELEQAKSICKLYGHSSEFASQVVSRLRAEIDGSAPFNAREAAKAYTGKGLFFRTKNTIKFQDMREQYDAMLGVELSDEKKKERTRLKEQLEKWERYDKEETDKATRDILQKFDTWALGNPNADYKAQARAFYDLLDKHSAEDSLIFDADKMASEVSENFEVALTAALQKRKAAGDELASDIERTDKQRAENEAAADEAARADADEQAAGGVQSMVLDRTRGVSNSWEGNSTEHILYVPKGHALAGKTVALSTPDDVQADAKVVEREGVTAPVMSQKLRVDMGLLKNPYSSLTFDGTRGMLSNEGFAADAAMAKKLGGLAPLYGTFVEAARVNGLDPNLLMAIAMHETGRGSSSTFQRKKNAMGVSNSEGPIAFKKAEDSIHYMARQLKKNYIDKGLTTIEQIAGKYAPVGAKNDPKNLNQHWVGGVTKYMNELKK